MELIGSPNKDRLHALHKVGPYLVSEVFYALVAWSEPLSVKEEFVHVGLLRPVLRLGEGPTLLESVL